MNNNSVFSQLLVRARRDKTWLLFIGGGAAIIAAWVFIPYVFRPYLRFPGSTVYLTLPCAPNSLSIHTLTAFYAPVQADLTLPPPIPGTPPITVPLQIEPVTGSHSLAFTLARSVGGPADVLQSAAYLIRFTKSPYVDVTEIDLHPTRAVSGCEISSLKGTDLRTAIKGQPAGVELMRYRVLQEEMSDLVFAFNATIGNILLGCMLVAFFWFSYILYTGLRRLFWSSDGLLIEELVKRYAFRKLTIKDKQAIVTAEFLALDRRLSFAKTIAPAVGFLLTVSSLSAALHTSDSTQDAFRLVSGIQLAIVATFLGLAIRIVTHIAQRTYRNVAERQINLLDSASGETAHGT